MNDKSSVATEGDHGIDRDAVFGRLDERPTMAAYTDAARALASISDELRPARIALLASFTVDSFAPFLAVEAGRLGFHSDIYIGPFNSINQEMLDPRSGCIRHDPDIVFVAGLLSDVSPRIADDFLGLSDAEASQLMGEVISEITSTLSRFRSQSSAAVVVWNFARSLYAPMGIYEASAEQSQTRVINELNHRLARALSDTPGVYVLDFYRLVGDVGYRNYRDDKMWALGSAPLSMNLLPELARIHAAFVHALLAPQRKCLVLDLDNTLWGGVVGEEGVAGIQLGHTFPGNIYREFQRAILQLHRRGILLAINSKNNRQDVDEVFKSHPDMILSYDHFAAVRANWRPKPDNMIEIADELNIGVDSLVFFDDNPAERELMKQALPQVLTLPAGSDPLKFSHILCNSHVFDRLAVTDEDRRRGKMYREQAARARLKESAGSVEKFLESLQMRVSISTVNDFAFPRVVDLLQKTNQFNLTTRRHPPAVVREMIEDPTVGVFCLRVEDRFGDNGIVGVGIVRARAENAIIDSFLLSCRVIGRTVETALLYELVEWAQSRALREIRGEFIETAKNAPAADFFSNHGFTQIGSSNGQTSWSLELGEIPFSWPKYLERDAERADH